MSGIKQYNEIKNEAISAILEIDKLRNEIKQQLNLDIDFGSTLKSTQTNLSNTKFTVAVVGVIKRGKSTLLNAILGDKLEILSTSVTPETAKLSYIIHDETPYAIIHKNDGGTIKIGLEELEKYTSSYSKTKLDFRHKHKGIKELVLNTKFAEIHYPNKYLKNGVVFVDTPGVDDPDESRSKVTEDFINKADAVIFLIDGLEGGLKESELKFLKSRVINRKNSKGIVCACNKILALRKFQIKELDSLLTTTKDILAKELGINIPIYPIDAKTAYESEQNGDKEAYANSKFATFLDGLEKTLIDDKGRIIIKKELTNLKGNALEPVIEALEFKKNTKPSELGRIASELESFKEQIESQRKGIDNFRVMFNSEKERLKSEIESEIRIAYRGIIVENNTIINTIENEIVRITQSTSDKTANLIRQTFSKLLAEISAYEISLPEIELMVNTPNLSSNDFFIERTHTSQANNAGAMGAGIGAAAVGFVFATGGLALLVGGLVGYFIGKDFESEGTTYTVKELDLNKVRSKINELMSNLIYSYNLSIDSYFNQFNNEIENWFDKQIKAIAMRQKEIQKVKGDKESEYFTTISKTEVKLENAKHLMTTINNLLAKVEQL